jgi:endoglucanase
VVARLFVGVLVCATIPVTLSSKGDNTTPDIRVDQVGYPSGFKKLAFVVHSGTQPLRDFELRRADNNQSVFAGTLSSASIDVNSGDAMQTADFTNVDLTGSFYVNVGGVGRSPTFRIAPAVYTQAYQLTARSFYGQRCGTAVNLGGSFHHDACHGAGGYDLSSGHSGAKASAQGWHDAGDYGRYVVSSGAATAVLLWAFELWGEGSIGHIDLHIPESGKGTPDLLAEARWNIEWMLSMQDVDGGVWHKQTSTHFCGFVLPDKDDLPSLVIGSGHAPFKTSCATGDFTAVAAVAARVYRPYDAKFAELCLTAAKKGWNWLESHPAETFHNPAGISTGEYGDDNCADEQLWAAAELARTTREQAFNDYFVAHYREFLDRISSDEPPNWASTAALGLWTYALGKGTDASAVKEIESRSVTAADAIAARTEQEGYRNTLVRKNYIWGSNGVAASYNLQLLISDRLAPAKRYREAAASNLHYLFGCNPFSLSYVTGLGSHSVRHIHHRPSIALQQPWPGLLSGGPNMNREDPEMKKAIGAETPPAKAFLDLQESYASNEVAINWNAPLVFSLAGLLSQ